MNDLKVAWTEKKKQAATVLVTVTAVAVAYKIGKVTGSNETLRSLISVVGKDHLIALIEKS